MFWGYHHLRKHPFYQNENFGTTWIVSFSILRKQEFRSGLEWSPPPPRLLIHHLWIRREGETFFKRLVPFSARIILLVKCHNSNSLLLLQKGTFCDFYSESSIPKDSKKLNHLMRYRKTLIFICPEFLHCIQKYILSLLGGGFNPFEKY